MISGEKIRACIASDVARLKEMHALQAFGYGLPDVNDPVFVGKWAIEEADPAGAGLRVNLAILARLTAEIYMLHDPTAGTPQERWLRLLKLHGAGEANLAHMGLHEVHAFLPPEVERAFGRRLIGLGWYKEPWACYTLELGGSRLEVGNANNVPNCS